MEQPAWGPGLKALVRRHRYDFAAAAAEVGATAKELRVELARQEFGGAAAAPPPPPPKPAPPPQQAPEPVLDSDDDVGPIDIDALRTRRGLVPPRPPSPPTKPQASWDAESFFREEQRRDRENFERKQKVFDRVLATLGGNQGTENVPRDVLEAFKRSREKEEDRLFEQEEAIRERAEARRLQAQRETLRRRFEKGSPDAVGLDPLAVRKPKEATETREELAKAAAAMMPRRGGSINYDPAGLDKILDGIEKEHGNIEDGPISAELSELFALMDAAPRSKKKSATPPRPPDKNNRFSALSSPERKPKQPKRGPASRGTPGGPSARSRDYGTRVDNDSDGSDDDDWRKARAARKTKA